MDLKVSDPELAYRVDLTRKSAEQLVEIATEYNHAIQVLLATGIQSSRVSAALAGVPPRVSAACAALEEAVSPLVPQTNQFIQNLDADDEDFD
ncbi:MAG: hypothetical protein QM302_08455 [Acidobacteriota bacterium]|nr:hypothetical protein [Acidobacteriota bacterium]